MSIHHAVNFGLLRDYICVKKAKRKNINTIIHFHCDVSYMIKSKLQKVFLKKIIKKANKIFVLNNASMDYINKISNNKKIYKVPNYINEKSIPEESIDIRREAKRIIYVGRVCKEKGCDNIINIAKLVPTIEFIIIGKLSEEFENIELPENVVMTGEISNEEVLEQMRQSDIFIFPTHSEGFPCALLEAMAIGLPIITTPVGAIPDMLEDKGGVYCQVGNEEQYIEQINNLILDRKKRLEMSEWNKKKVMNSYLQNKVINDIFKIYCEEKEK